MKTTKMIVDGTHVVTCNWFSLSSPNMKVVLHSNDEPAANATDSTLKMLPMGGNAHLKRGEDGKVEFDADGRATVITTNPGFVAFALRNQGYVRAVVD